VDVGKRPVALLPLLLRAFAVKAALHQYVALGVPDVAGAVCDQLHRGISGDYLAEAYGLWRMMAPVLSQTTMIDF
jgi:hypothetical protein